MNFYCVTTIFKDGFRSFIETALDIGASRNLFLEETESRATSKNRAFLEAVKNTNRL